MKKHIKLSLLLVILFLSFSSYTMGLGDSYSKILADSKKINGASIYEQSDQHIVLKMPEWAGYYNTFFFDNNKTCRVAAYYQSEFSIRMDESVHQGSGAKQLEGAFVNIKGSLKKVNIWFHKDRYLAYFSGTDKISISMSAFTIKELMFFLDLVIEDVNNIR